MLRGKIALVTGSTRGIGRGMARALASAGCRLMLHGLEDPAVVEEVRAEVMRLSGHPAAVSRADLTQPEAIGQLVATAERELGGIDILVSNAGVQHTAPLEAFPVDAWDRILAVNLSAAFHLSRLVLPAMRRQHWGRIIHTASVHGLVASIHKAAYVASKHGLVGLTKVIALEAAGSGVTCNAICPGWTRTELIEPQIAARAKQLGVDLTTGARELLAEKQPSQEFVTVDQLGQLVVFLCSSAADQITGAALPVDGGWTAQ